LKKNDKKYQNNKSTIKKATIIPEKKNDSVLSLIIVFCLPVFLYLQTIGFRLTHFDDGLIIINNTGFLKNFGNAYKAFLTDAFLVNLSPFYRPMQTLSYMVDMHFMSGNNIWMFHLSNVLLLGSIACSLFLLLRKFSIQPKLALLGTLIYCMHPLFVSSVAWIPARGDLLLTLFAILSFLFFIEFLQKKKYIYLFLNWIAFTIALFCKETAVFIPFILIIYFFTFPKEKRFENIYILPVLLYAVSGIVWLCLRSMSIGDYSNSSGVYGLAAIKLNLQTIPESLANFFLPFDFAPIPGFSILKTAAGLVIIILIGILLIKNEERSKKEKIFCLSWFLLFMFPTMLFKGGLIDYLCHRFFLPLIGILLFSLFLIPKKWFENGDIKRSWLMIVVIVLLSSFTFIKSRAYSDPMTFYDSAISYNSNSALAYNNRGHIKFNKKDYDGAVEDYNKAIAISPTFSEAFNNRGVLKLNTGDKAGALSDFNAAISTNTRYAEAYSNRGLSNLDMGNIQEAIRDYKTATAIRPNYAEAYNGVGMGMNATGNYKEAIINLNKAIEIKPEYLNAYGNRAIAKYRSKDLSGAIKDCEKVLELNPDDKTAIKLKAEVQLELQKANH